jgi:glycosyltransferase involved in cell wall biosynthesis
MKILMISAGLPPKRTGGVPLYVTDLRNELARRGYDVRYLDSNCQDASGRARIVQTADSSLDYSFFNSGRRFHVGVMPTPEAEINAPADSKKCLLDFVNGLKPDIVHFHETLCVPLDLLSALRDGGHTVVCTVEDYSPVCPTVQLFTHAERLCTLKTDELVCETCVRKWPVTRLPTNADWANPKIKGAGLVARAGRALLRYAGLGINPLLVRRDFRKEAYRARRVEAVKHLKACDLLICMSKQQYALMTKIVGDSGNMRQVYLSLGSYAEARPKGAARQIEGHGDVIRFAALNTNQINKGGELLLREFQELRAEIGNVELHLFGDKEGVQSDGVVYHGSYDRSELDSLLAPMDVGVIPSRWPEAYAYVGPEMLMRGIPLIVSVAGAMPEYVIREFNGLVFDPTEPGSLKLAMRKLATDPALLSRLKVNAPSSTQGIVPFSEHVDEMESIYSELCGSAQ